MAGPLPHTSQIQEMMEGYIGDAKDAVESSFASLKHSTQFRNIYRISLATDAVLFKLQTRNERLRLAAARSVILRIPLLVAMGQVSVACIELRRFLEILFWYIYFSDHPVEWGSFQETPDKGYGRALDDPIFYCAHREMTFYMNYAKERMKAEPSGIAKEAVNELRQVRGDLNAVVHPGMMAISAKKTLPFDDLSTQALTAFYKIQRRVFSRGCILMAAYRRKQFDKLPSMNRAHFDWLTGTPMAKKIRSGPFGLTK